MKLEEVVNSRLSSMGSLNGRVYLMNLPEGTALPAITITSISVSRDQALNGDMGLTKQTMQINVHAKTYSQSLSLSDEVRTVLFSTNGHYENLEIQAVLESGQTFGFDSLTENFLVYLEYLFFMKEGT